MKNRIFLSILFLIGLIEGAVLIFFMTPQKEYYQDAVVVNEVLHTIQNDWNCLEEHVNHTDLDYIVLDCDGAVLYRTKSGLSESINSAISHKDTILDIEVDETVVGKLIVYNSDARFFQYERQNSIFIIIAAMLLQCGICAGYFFYIKCTVINPFNKLKNFAERVAGGNLDIPLEMDRRNLFGAFTESFDIMRSELKRARIAEARANESKKELVAKLSHDIKTPVASIKAASEVGVALSTDEKNKANYQQIIQKADQINTLVTNLFSATLEELQELSVSPTDIESEELYTLLENADYLNRAEIPAVPDCLLFADRLRLQQVFDNIFANSYKYADTKIDITISVRDNYLVVSVEDYGGGIDESELPFLKEKFKRGGNTKNIEGAGLGLYISDYCMKKMQGQLDIENGTTGLRVTVMIHFSSTI